MAEALHSASQPCRGASNSRKVQARTGAIRIDPYDDDRIIAGQGTAAKELLEDVPDLDVVIAPVSAGGLLSGTAIASKGIRPQVRVIGAEPKNADDAFQSCVPEKSFPALRRTRLRMVCVPLLRRAHSQSCRNLWTKFPP